MKLPGITYGQVQTLGRKDVSGEVQKGAANARALESVAGLMGDIYEKQSVTQAEKALLMYDTGMAEWSQQQTAYQADGSGTWLKGDDLYGEAEQANRKVANQELQTPMAKMLFERKSEQRNAENQVKWGAKQLGWMHEDNRATAYKTIDEYTSMREFGKVYETVAREKRIGTLNPLEAEKIVSETAYLQNYYVHSDAVENVQDANTGREAIQAINADKRLEERDKVTLVKATEDGMLQITTDKTFAHMTNTMNVDGIDAAIREGIGIFDAMRDTDAENLGSDENYKLAAMNRVQQIINTFKSEQVKMTGEALREIKMNRVDAEFDPVSSDVNHQQLNDILATKYLGWGLHGGGSEYIRTTPQVDLYLDPELSNVSVGLVDRFKVLPSLLDDSLSAALEDKGGKFGLPAVGVIHEISKTAPMALFKRKNHDMNAIAALSEMLGGDETAYKLAWDRHVKVRDMPPEMIASFYHPETFKAAVDDNFDSLFKKNYPVDNPIWAFWETSNATVKQRYKTQIIESAKLLLPMADGVPDKALDMAMYNMRPAFGVTKVSGDGEPQLAENPPEQFVVNGDYDGGKWMRNQALGDIETAYPGYNTDYIQFQPVADFDPNDALYTPVDNNPELGGMVRYFPPMRFDFEVSPEYAQQQTDAETQHVVNETERDRMQKAIQWETEKDPTKKIRGLSGGRNRRVRNPYGSTDQQGSMARIAQNVYQGFEAAGGKLADIDRARIEAFKWAFTPKGTGQRERKGRNR